jgi:hypothetical protein
LTENGIEGIFVTTFYDEEDIELAGVLCMDESGKDSAVAQEVGMRRAHPGSIGGQTHRVVEIPPWSTHSRLISNNNGCG